MEQTHEHTRRTADPDVAAVIGWWTANARDLPWRASRDVYAVWISEVMYFAFAASIGSSRPATSSRMQRSTNALVTSRSIEASAIRKRLF